MIEIKVVMQTATKPELIALAKYMLEAAGYSAPSLAPAPTPEEIDADDLPALAETAAAGWPCDTPVAPGIQVDSAGMPWDHRIHASSRAKVTDGTWRQRRNLDLNVLASVEAEMKAVMGLPPVPSTAQAVATPTTGTGGYEATGSVASPAVLTPEQAFVASVPTPPAAVAVPVPPPFADSVVIPAVPPSISPATVSAGAAVTASPSSAAPTFPQLVGRITKMLAAKELDQAAIAGACAALNIPHMPALAARPDLVPAMAAALGIAL